MQTTLAPARPHPLRGRTPAARIIIGGILALIILVGLIVLITWLVVDPKKLKYSIETASITHFNMTIDNLNADLHFVLRAINTNRRISFYYDRIEATTWYDDQKLSVNDVHPFYQPRRNVTHLDLDLAARDVGLYGAVARDLKMDRAAGEVDLDVKIRVKIRLKIGVFKIHRKLKVDCGPVTVPFTSSKGFKRVDCDTDLD